MPPLVSVVIPCYNAAPWIGEAIESVFAQTYPDVEIVAVDDGSTDATREVLARYEDRITILHQENSGAPAARNLGMAHARGDFIQFLDADDELFPTKIAVSMQAFDDNVDVVACGSGSGNPYGARKRDPLRILRGARRKRCTRDPSDLPASILCRPIHTMEPVYRRAALERAGAWDETLSANQDIELGFRLAALGVGIRFLPDRPGRIRSHRSPSRIRLQPDMYVGVLRATRVMHAVAEREGCLTGLVRQRLADRYARWGRIAYQKGARDDAREAFSAAYSLSRRPLPSTIPAYNVLADVLGLERLARWTAAIGRLGRSLRRGFTSHGA